MTERRWRFGLLLLIIAILLPLFIKSRTVPQRGQAAFFHYTTGYLLVKVKGTIDRDGIYRFPDGATIHDVKIMTGTSGRTADDCRVGTGIKLKNGHLVEFALRGGDDAEITVKSMPAAELMLLGIPLSPDEMTIEDWEALPGIGPSLATAIINDRQKYGDFGDLGGVLRVPGVGEGKIKALRRFFKRT